MNNTIYSTIILDDRNTTNNDAINNKKIENVDTDFQKKYIYNIKITSDSRKIINKKNIESDDIHVKIPDNSDISSKNSNDTEIGWFSVLDDKGYERFIRDGHVTINEKREVAMDNYTALDNNDRPIVVPVGIKILIKNAGIIVIKEDNHQKGQAPIFLGQLKSTLLNDNDVVAQKNSKMYDLNSSGLEKYKKNDLKLKSKLMSKETMMQNYEKETINLMNTLKLVRLIESDMTAQQEDH
ncbi:Flagellar basal-body rod protein FlgF [Buchnera aphidicola (Cinara pseudotaxifoliae)]|uniref:Flagellar basal-body rod protein FlgF n=1 Tax=Buchnera aphidicola (Cinara pseudotaxifoliae) TaxID=655384 RepID=A0A451DH55_9GAMM|nr:hypothetical protein [Buchnera aphidicola]VFP85948.1 Flagellar basal-body rod protein FlgF [Buchnera aphidicola (Cinara pseudotaxifoliae)]